MMQKWISLLVIMIVWLTACGAAGLEPAMMEATAVPQPPTDEEIVQHDLEQLAEQTGIPLEELAAQLQNDEAIGELNARLEANEADTFAGLWLEWEPAFQVVVAFTQNGAETVANYVDEEEALAAVLDIRTATYTQEQLLADQQSLNSLLATADFGYNTSVDIKNNRVELGVPTEELWTAYMNEHNIQLPASVTVTFAFPEGIHITPPPNLTPMPDIYMAQLTIPSMDFMQALLEANLVVDNNCLMAQYPDMPEEKWLIIWQPGYFVHEENGRIQILDQSGAVVAEVGEKLYMGGGEGPLHDDLTLAALIPEPCRTNKVWYMGEFLPEEYRN